MQAHAKNFIHTFVILEAKLINCSSQNWSFKILILANFEEKWLKNRIKKCIEYRIALHWIMSSQKFSILSTLDFLIFLEKIFKIAWGKRSKIILGHFPRFYASCFYGEKRGNFELL